MKVYLVEGFGTGGHGLRDSVWANRLAAERRAVDLNSKQNIFYYEVFEFEVQE